MTPNITSDVSDRARIVAHYLSHEGPLIECWELRERVVEAAALLTLQDAELIYLRTRLAFASASKRNPEALREAHRAIIDTILNEQP